MRNKCTLYVCVRMICFLDYNRGCKMIQEYIDIGVDLDGPIHHLEKAMSGVAVPHNHHFGANEIALKFTQIIT